MKLALDISERNALSKIIKVLLNMYNTQNINLTLRQLQVFYEIQKQIKEDVKRGKK